MILIAAGVISLVILFAAYIIASSIDRLGSDPKLRHLTDKLHDARESLTDSVEANQER